MVVDLGRSIMLGQLMSPRGNNRPVLSGARKTKYIESPSPAISNAKSSSFEE
jgi:hypothetical protein